MTNTLTELQSHVFVYGTLRRGEERDINHLQPAPVFIGNSQIQGTLYHLGSYPGVRLGGSSPVQGEVYQITPELEHQLDAIEAVWPPDGAEYSRQKVQVKICQPTGAVVHLWCLIYEASLARISGMPKIVSGDWLCR